MKKDIFVDITNRSTFWEEPECKIKVVVKHSGHIKDVEKAEIVLCELINKFIKENLKKEDK